ncbi:hypothetical protein [Jatrophihabitans endophyticus]|nr:hypothetical protein [Jatrophihabitans endophyticus]
MPPCPWWCSDTNPDHRTDFESSDWNDPSVKFRIHTHVFGRTAAAVVQDERHEAGRVTLVPAYVAFYYDQAETPEEALDLARAIEAAGDLLRRVVEGREPPSAGQAPSWATTHEDVEGGIRWEHTAVSPVGRAVTIFATDSVSISGDGAVSLTRSPVEVYVGEDDRALSPQQAAEFAQTVLDTVATMGDAR